MSEINNIPNKIGNSKPKRPDKIASSLNNQPEVQQPCTDSNCETSKNAVAFGSDVIGRSMVSANNVSKDVSFGMKNPDAILKADLYFDKVYNQFLKAGDPNAYAKAAVLAEAFVNEVAQ